MASAFIIGETTYYLSDESTVSFTLDVCESVDITYVIKPDHTFRENDTLYTCAFRYLYEAYLPFDHSAIATDDADSIQVHMIYIYITC